VHHHPPADSTALRAPGPCCRCVELDLSWNSLAALPDVFSGFEFLERLLLSHNKLSALPKSFDKLAGRGGEGLSIVALDHNELCGMAAGGGPAIECKELLLGNNQQLRSLDSFRRLRVKELSVPFAGLSSVPNFVGVKMLSLPGNSITELPWRALEGCRKHIKASTRSGPALSQPRTLAHPMFSPAGAQPVAQQASGAPRGHRTIDDPRRAPSRVREGSERRG
jgi:hypothetical protein